MVDTIVYYHGCFVNYFDHETGFAVVRALEKNGFRVEVPELMCCGFPLFNSGHVDEARERAKMVVDALSDFTGQGCEVVYSCPTCGYALNEIYPALLASEDAESVAERTSLITAYLLDIHKTGNMNINFKKVSFDVAYHTPCHLRSQDLPTASSELMALIPGVEARHLDRGCCGMGGTWALKSKRRNRLSEDIGEPLFKEIRETNPELIATDCAGCKIQIARYTGSAGDRIVHPMQILDEAYV
jgi:glycerol-3-phosphate dehydrogenase subunit C